MQLTKLEINGFKSFAKKTELVFEQGITGILGPNGCGKSNIADAFRFVLGEQSARALRGKKVEDFIFGGTEKRRPLSYCEVTMYFDNSDGMLASPYSEVAVTRRAFRSGESEYYINKNACRLKDIQELFRDTGIGKDGYSIIGQGRVSDILSDRSGERRVVFEEAAGVMKYRTRKEEAERKLQNTEKNLVRLEDIIRELESRLEPLREQSEKANEYFKLREELRDLEINLYLYQYDKSNERIALLREQAKQLGDELITASAEEESFASVCAEEESTERSLSASISEASEKLIAFSSSVESQLGDEKLLRERISTLNREIEQAAADKAAVESQIAAGKETIAVLENTMAGFSNDTAALDKSLEEAEARFRALEENINSKETELEARKQAMMEAMNRLADTKSRVSRLAAMRESFVSRLGSLSEERHSAEEEAEKLDAELAEIREAIGFVNGELDKLGKERAAHAAKASQLQNGMVDEQKQLRKAEDELNAISSRAKVLEEMRRAHEGYYASVRNLLRDASRDPELGKRIHGVVAELINVPEKYERAIEMALGASLQNIIVPTEQDAKAVIGHLRSREYGRATLLPVSAMRSRLLTNEEKSFINVEGCYGIASELVGFSPAFKNVIENLLGRTVIVRDIDTGIMINKRAKSAFRIATLEGDILNPGGSMTGGSVQKREFSLLGREREIEELAAKKRSISGRVEELGASVLKKQAQLAQAARTDSEFGERMQKLRLSLASNNEKADIIEKYVQKNKETLSKLDAERSMIDDSIADIDRESAEAEKAEHTISKGNTVTNDDIRLAQQVLAGLRAELQRANEETTALKVRQMAAAKEKNAASAEKVRLERENEQLSAKLVERAQYIVSAGHSIKALESELAELDSALGSERERVNALTDELHAMQAEREAHLRLLDESRGRREQVLLQISELKERLHRNELQHNKLSIDLDNMAERIWQDYELTYENALPFRRQLPVTQMHMRIDELRKGIKELGEVNTSAVEDYRSVKERFDDLSSQCEDLNKAKQDLNVLIGKLTETMENEFKVRFEQIRQNFSETFHELFGGGRAELVLADKNDVLNSNIDIIAQPPGKKLQLLTLLSGGEQALTAIALLFAILRLKPAAFCILDEIDTSLDEANVDCFANYLKGYSKGTQFIIITHRKGSMAVCNALFGVSMEEKGVSSIVSAKFE